MKKAVMLITALSVAFSLVFVLVRKIKRHKSVSDIVSEGAASAA